MNFFLKKITSENKFNFFSINIFFISFLFLIGKSFLGSSEFSDFIIFFSIILSNEIIFFFLIKKYIYFEIKNFNSFLLIFVCNFFVFFIWSETDKFFQQLFYYILSCLFILFLYYFHESKLKLTNLLKLQYLKNFFIVLIFFGLFANSNLNLTIFLFILISISIVFYLSKNNKFYFNYFDYFFSILFFLIFFKVYALSSVKDSFHYSWYIGPVNSILNGGTLLFDTVSQYGYLNILIIKFLSNLFNVKAELILVSLIVSFLVIFIYLLYINLEKELKIPKIIIVSSIVFFSLANMGFSGTNGSLFIPSSSVYRFFPSVIFFLLITNIDLKSFFNLKVVFLFSVSLFLSLFWSFESFIFTIGTVFLSSIFCLLTNNNSLKILFNKKIILFIFFFIIFIISFFYKKEFIFFYEYSLNFVNSSSAIEFTINFYVLFFFSFFAFIYYIWRESLNPNNSIQNFTNTNWFLLSIAISSYFLIRTHPNNLFNILPFLIFCTMKIKLRNNIIKKIGLFFLLNISIFISSGLLSTNFKDFKNKLFSKNYLILPKFEKVFLDKNVKFYIDKYSDIPVTIITSKIIHNPIENINSKGYGMPILPLEQFNILSIERKSEIYKKIFSKRDKHLLICIDNCNFYSKEENRNSWNDIFLPEEITKKDLLVDNIVRQSIFLLQLNKK